MKHKIGKILSIDPITPEEFNLQQVNSIQVKYPKLRQKSKGITFAAQYFGTYLTFMENSGLDEQTAKQVEQNYKDLYQVSSEWKNTHLLNAEHTGFVTCAFGLKVRTPLLSKTLTGKKSTPKAAEAERRSAGNALTQSYGLLNSRAANAFRKRLRASPYAFDVKIVALIHDAIYLLIRDSLAAVTWVNNNLIECMEWCELPELYHEKVKLGAELDLFYNGWHQAITIKNRMSQEQLQTLVRSKLNELNSTA